MTYHFSDVEFFLFQTKSTVRAVLDQRRRFMEQILGK